MCALIALITKLAERVPNLTMTVLFFLYFTHVDNHHATELELVQRHLDAGDDVQILYCDGRRGGCEINPRANRLHCMCCLRNRTRGLRLLDKAVKTEPWHNSLSTADYEKVNDVVGRLPSTSSELRTFEIDGYDLGMGVLSALITRTGDAEASPRANKSFVEGAAKYGYSVFLGVTNYLRQKQVDKVYVVNGRLPASRAIVKACRQANIPFATFDEGHSPAHYGVFENATPHDRSYFQERMNELWQSGADAPDQRERTARLFFEERVGAINAQGWLDRGFTRAQNKGMLPSGWNPTQHNVAIFSSSEDEFAAIGPEWRNPLYEDQLDGVRKICGSIADGRRGDVKLYLRVHPNFVHMPDSYREALWKLASETCEIIAPDSPVSTYTLMSQADRIVTFGSTIGIEATFWGKPSILAAQCFYRELGATYNPESHDELIDLITRPQLEPLPAAKALIYGYYWKTFGTPYRYTEQTEQGVRYRGCNLGGQSLLMRAMARFSRHREGKTVPSTRSQKKESVSKS